jgi:hypothetical protein
VEDVEEGSTRGRGQDSRQWGWGTADGIGGEKGRVYASICFSPKQTDKTERYPFTSLVSELVNIRQLRTKQMVLKATGKLKIKVPRRENTIISR